MKQFIRYFIVGGSGVVLDLATLYLFKNYLGFSAVVSVVVNQIVIFCYIFFLNKYWTFASQGIVARQMVRYFLVAFGNYLFAIFWMWLFHDKFGYYYLGVRVANIMLSVAWNFLLYRRFVYA